MRSSVPTAAVHPSAATRPMASASERAGPLELGEVYRAHVGFVCRALAAFGIPAASQEDLVHEVFLVVGRKLARYDRTRSMRGWLYGIARGEARHFHRASRRRARRVTLAPEPSAPPLPEERLRWIEGAHSVETFLAQLDADKRAAFFMSEIEGMTAPEIAEVTGAKLATVYSRIRAAKQRFDRFARSLQDDGEAP